MSHHLVRRAGVYHFRVRVPADLRKIVHKTEISRSLRTGNRRLAKRRADGLSKALRNFFLHARNGELDDMTDAEITSLVNRYLLALLAKDEHARVMGIRKYIPPDADFPGWGGLALAMKNELALSKFEELQPEVKKLMDTMGVDVELGSYEHRKLTRELLKVLPVAWDIMTHRDMGDYDFEKQWLREHPIETQQKAPERPSTPPDTTAPQQEPEHLLEDVIARWKDDVFSEFKPNTRKEYDNAMRLLLTIHGNTPITTLDHAGCRAFMDQLRKLPSNWRKKKKYRDKTIKQLMAMNIPDEDRLNARTVINISGHITNFLNWAVGQGFVSDNFLKGKAPRKGKATGSTRQPYSPEDMRAIFHSKEYLEDTFNKPFKFWLPLLGLFTGARLEELCQLHIEDVRQVDGVWCLDINDEDEKQLKNAPSRRLVPLHPVLTKTLKFHKWVERKRQKGHKRIFPELNNRSKGSYSHYPSRWYNSIFRKACGVSEPFHALRNTMAATLKQLNVEEGKAHELLGHKYRDMTYGHYAGMQYSPKILLNDALKKVKFPVDLDHLRKSKFLKGLK